MARPSNIFSGITQYDVPHRKCYKIKQLCIFVKNYQCMFHCELATFQGYTRVPMLRFKYG